MAKKTLSLADLIANQGGAVDKDGKTPVGDLLAETLTCKVTTPDGTVVVESTMIPRIFTAKEVKGQKGLSSAAGWQFVGPVSEEDSSKREQLKGNYRGLPCRVNFMLFLPVRADAGDDLDLRTAEEKTLGAFESDGSDDS